MQEKRYPASLSSLLVRLDIIPGIIRLTDRNGRVTVKHEYVMRIPIIVVRTDGCAAFLQLQGE
jgi:hypothetical protein